MKERLICLLTSVGALLLACGLVACGGVTPNAQGSVVITPNTSLPIEEPSDGSQIHSCNFEAEVVSPTCTERGYTVYTCECGETYIDDYAQPLDHLFTNYVSDNNATCTKDGTKTAECDRVDCKATDTVTDENSKLEHTYSETWNYDDTYHWRNATCGCELETDKGEHTYKTDGNCSVCSRDTGLVFTVSNGAATVTDYTGTASHVVIPEKYNNLPVTEIGYQAFMECRNLTSVSIPDSVIYIGYKAFSWCTSLTSFIIPDSVIGLDDYVFERCDSLSKVAIGASLKYCGSEFKSGGNIYEGAIEKVVEYGASSFDGCYYGLTNIEVSENNPYFCDVDGVLYTKDKTIVLRYPNGRQAQSFTVPDYVTGIAGHAFDGSDIVSIKMNNVTKIGSCAFQYCNLSTVELSNCLTSIGYEAFADSYNLHSIIIPRSVEIIERNAFRGFRYDESDSITIYSEAESKPSGWDPYWLGDSDMSYVSWYWYSETKPTGQYKMYWHYGENGEPVVWD